MRRRVRGVVFGAAIGVALVWGCAASNDTRTSGSGGSDTTSGTGLTTGSTGTGVDIDAGDSGFDPDAACAKFTAEAKQAPAALLFVLDGSASMSQSQKWGTAQLATATAIDKDVFDTMSLGLVRFPANFVGTPQCLCDYCVGDCTCFGQIPMGVACGVSFLPQVALAPAGLDKTNAPQGVRHDIYQYLISNNPLTNDPSDASPIYDALSAGYAALKAYPGVDKRLLVLITDGGFSCTSLSSPPRPGYSDGACGDWEYPDTVNTLITQARTDAAAPINTFIVGVPGSNSTGQMQGSYATAPYHMRLALSTYAVSGSPDTVDPACDKSATFTQNGADPAAPCHIDLSNGASFNPDALAQAITDIRGKALGCLYDLPAPPPGETIDLGQVNVNVTLDSATTALKKRSDPADTCAQDGCWDYKTEGTTTKVEIIGKTCTDISAATDAKVDILVGCATVIK